MKLSNYAWIVRHENTYILYKCHHETLVAIEEPLKELLEKGDWEVLEEMHPTFFAYLVERGFLLEDHVDESREVIAEWEREDADRSVYSIIINPTMDCNMRCWYCYEKHEKGSVMSDEMVETVLRFIGKKVQSPELKQLNLNFFGGEPLLYYKKVIRPILERTASLCHSENKNLYLHITTNGYLLNERVLSSIKSYTSNVVFQIAIDGNEEVHNETKYLGGKGDKTYAHIMENAKSILSQGLYLTLRCNCTLKNIHSFADVAKELSVLSEDEKRYLTIDFQQVWQDYTNDIPEFHEGCAEVRKIFQKNDIYVKVDRSIDPRRCYADKDTGVVINYNGHIYSCTAREFNIERSEGTLSSSAELLWNEKKELRRTLRYGNKTCQACSIYPLCHGRCTQMKLDTGNNTGCICQYSENKKRELIKSRIGFLINNINKLKL